MTAPKVDLSRVRLHHMAKPATVRVWVAVAKALVRGVLIGTALAAVFAAGLAAVVASASWPSPMPVKVVKVVV